MNKLIQILRNANNDEIRDYLLNKELEFYNNDMKDIIISLGFYVPNYNKLTSILEIEDNTAPIKSEFFAIGSVTNIINLYPTNVCYLYLIRKEQFGLGDEDAIITELVFTEDVESIVKQAKNDLSTRNIVRESKNNIRK